MSAAVSVLIALLSNEKLVNLIVSLLARLVDNPDNAVDPEYLEFQAKSLQSRVIDNRVPDDGNVALPQVEIERIKEAHRAAQHEKV